MHKTDIEKAWERLFDKEDKGADKKESRRIRELLLDAERHLCRSQGVSASKAGTYSMNSIISGDTTLDSSSAASLQEALKLLDKL